MTGNMKRTIGSVGVGVLGTAMTALVGLPSVPVVGSALGKLLRSDSHGVGRQVVMCVIGSVASFVLGGPLGLAAFWIMPGRAAKADVRKAYGTAARNIL